MKFLVILMIAVLTASNVTGVNMGFAPGVNVKNILMYMTLALLALRAVVSRDFKIELPGLLACFLALIAYGILTYLIGAVVIEYPNYKPLETAMKLVRVVVDPILFFLVVFYGVKTERDSMTLLKVFAIIFAIADFCTLTDVMGVTRFGVLIGDDGIESNRVFGFFGHANETAAMLIFLIPIKVAFAIKAQGIRRALWALAVGIGLTVFLLNGSKGGFLGMVVGSAWAAYICRRYIDFRRLVVPMAAGAAFMLFVVFPLVSWKLGNVLFERILGDLQNFGLESASSGRSQIWSQALGRMSETPIAFVTGFGWDSWKTMKFETDNPHSHYLWLWFEFGILGLATFALTIRQLVTTAFAALERTDGEVRLVMTGFIFGMMALTVAVMSTVLLVPWPFIYAVIGAAMRLALTAESAAESVPEAAQKQSTTAPSMGFGWKRREADLTGAARRGR